MWDNSVRDYYAGILAASKSREYCGDHPRPWPDLWEIRLILYYIRRLSSLQNVEKRNARRDVTHVHVRIKLVNGLSRKGQRAVGGRSESA